MTTHISPVWATVVICILVAEAAAQDYIGDSSTRTGYACEGSTLSIQCPDTSRIVIQRANYGRFNPSICNDGRNPVGWDLQCMSTRSLSIVTDLCSGRYGNCGVIATNRLFGEPCSMTPKYLEVQYRCEVPRVTSPTPIPSSTTDVFDDYDATSTESSSAAQTTTTSTTTSASTTTTTTTTTSTASSPSSSSSSVNKSVSDETPREETEKSDDFCEAVNERHVDWPRTAPGTTVEMTCPNNDQLLGAVWQCGTDPVEWIGRPDLSRCISQQVSNIQSLVNDTREDFSPQRLEMFAEDLQAFTDMQEEVFGGDLAEITAAMQAAVEEIEEHFPDIPTVIPGDESTHLMQKVNDAVLTTTSYLLDEERYDSWMDLPQGTQAETATKLLSTVENSAHQLAKKCEQPTVIINVTVNIVLEIKVVDVSGNAPVEDAVFPRLDPSKHGSWSSGGDSIRLTGETIRELGVDGLAKMIFATYSNLDRYLNPQGDDANALAAEAKARPTPYRGIPYQPAESSPERKYESANPFEGQEMADDIETDVITVQYDEGKVDDELAGKFVNTKIISASLGDRSSDEPIPLKEPVIYTLEHQTKDNVFNPSCSFWEFSEKTMSGKWSTFGCEIVDTNVTHTTCACRHLTNFAVLMSLKAQTLSKGHEFTLSLITYFGCILSLVCLLAAFCTFQFFKNLQSDRNTIHKNLVASLFVAELVFLIGIVQYRNVLLCSIIAGVLHYLFLAAFAWMCLEGIQIYIMLVEVFEVEKSRVGWFYAAGYGVPAIIVAVSAAVRSEGYGTPTYCWLSTEDGFIWSFVGPVCGIIVVNVIMLSIAMYVMCRHASSSAANWKTKDMSKLETARAWIKGAAVLIVLLGPTWIIGIFYLSSQSIIMAYLFTVFNSVQGVFIFVFHCLMNDKVIKEYKRWVRHTSWMPSNLRMRCGGTKATTPSTTPNNSSSSGVNHSTTNMYEQDTASDVRKLG